MASNVKDSHASPGTAVAELLPDPTGDITPAPIADADDLIASIADQQIESLINDAQEHDAAPAGQTGTNPTSADSAAELAEQATQELAAMAEELNEQVTADLVADLTSAARDATAADHAAKALDVLNETKTGNETKASDPVSTVIAESAPAVDVAGPAIDPQPEPVAATALEPTPGAEASAAIGTIDAIEMQATPAAVVEVASNAAPPPENNAAVAEENQTAAHASAEPEAPAPGVSGAMSLAPPDAEINQAEIAALIADGNPAESKPLHHAADVAKSLESGAEEVARELAQEAAAVAAHLPEMPTTQPAHRVRDAVGSSGLAVLSLINLPFRSLPDSAREVIGIIAIVTLVNAMSLLLYLMIFR